MKTGILGKNLSDLRIVFKRLFKLLNKLVLLNIYSTRVSLSYEQLHQGSIASDTRRKLRSSASRLLGCGRTGDADPIRFNSRLTNYL